LGKRIRIFEAAEKFSELENNGVLIQAFTTPFQAPET